VSRVVDGRDEVLPPNAPGERWALTGGNSLVKVVRFKTDPRYKTGTKEPKPLGYVTLQKNLFSKRPTEIETALGLPPLSLSERGCSVYRLLRLPTIGEFSDELTADFPNGLKFNPADAWEARIRYDKDRSLREVPYHPPGGKNVRQWDVKVQLPLVLLHDLPPPLPYPDVPL